MDNHLPHELMLADALTDALMRTPTFIDPKAIREAVGVIRDLYYRVQELEVAISTRAFECSYNSTKKSKDDY